MVALETMVEKRRVARFFLILILLVVLLSLAMTACGDGAGGTAIDGKNDGVIRNGPGNSFISSPDATATFGAKEFHIQLTAIATQEVSPLAP
jgi:hypothetical protein